MDGCIATAVGWRCLCTGAMDDDEMIMVNESELAAHPFTLLLVCGGSLPVDCLASDPLHLHKKMCPLAMMMNPTQTRPRRE